VDAWGRSRPRRPRPLKGDELQMREMYELVLEFRRRQLIGRGQRGKRARLRQHLQQSALRRRQTVAGRRHLAVAGDSTTPYRVGFVISGRPSDFVSPLGQAFYDARIADISCENCMESTFAMIIAMHMPIAHPLVGCRFPIRTQDVSYFA
jgi:hypothetical protein